MSQHVAVFCSSVTIETIYIYIYVYTWDSRPRSSWTAALRRGSRHVLVAGGVAPATSDQWEGRGQQLPLQTWPVEQGRRSTMVEINLERKVQKERRNTYKKAEIESHDGEVWSLFVSERGAHANVKTMTSITQHLCQLDMFCSRIIKKSLIISSLPTEQVLTWSDVLISDHFT